MKKKQKDNENNKIQGVDIAEEILNRADQKFKNDTERRKYKYFLLRTFGFDGKRASELCGFTERNGRRWDKFYREDQNLRTRLQHILAGVKAQYLDSNLLKLLVLDKAEQAAVEEYLKDPKLLIDKPQLAKHMKQAAGVLGSDDQQPPQTVNIGAVQNLMLQVHKGAHLPAGAAIEGPNRARIAQDEDET